MFNDRIYLGTSTNSYRNSYATSSPLLSRKTYTGSPSSSASPSNERLNSSFNRGKDGIFRPKSLLSLATEIDFVSSSAFSPSSTSRSSPISIGSNPRLAQFRSHHRDSSVPRHTDSGYSSPHSRSRTSESTFYSNFNDNLTYLGNSSHSAYSSRHRTSYLPSSNYQSYKFTTSYYAPKVRDRPLLSNLRVKFASRTHSSSSSSRNTSISSNSSSHNSVSSSETIVPPRLERNKFLIKFRENNLSQSSNKRRGSISWDIPGAVNFAVKSATHVEVKEAIQENEPEPSIKDSNKDVTSNEAGSERTGELVESESARDENNNNLTRWNGSMALNTLEETDICLRNGAIKEPEPVEDRLQREQLCERCDLCLSEEQQQTAPLTTIDLIGSSVSRVNKQLDSALEPSIQVTQTEETSKEKIKKKKKKVYTKSELKDVPVESKPNEIVKVPVITETQADETRLTKDACETKVGKKNRIKESKEIQVVAEVKESTDCKVIKKTKIKEVNLTKDAKENKETSEINEIKPVKVKETKMTQLAKDAKENKEVKETSEMKNVKVKDVEIVKEAKEDKETKVTKVIKKTKPLKEGEVGKEAKVDKELSSVSSDKKEIKTVLTGSSSVQGKVPATEEKNGSVPEMQPKAGRSNDISPSKRNVATELSTEQKQKAKSSVEPLAKDRLQVNHQESKSRSVSPETQKTTDKALNKEKVTRQCKESRLVAGEAVKPVKTVTFATDSPKEIRPEEVTNKVVTIKAVELEKKATESSVGKVSLAKADPDKQEPVQVRVESIIQSAAMTAVSTVNGASAATSKDLTRTEQLDLNGTVTKVKAKKKKESSEKENEGEKVKKKKIKKMPTQELVCPATEQVGKCAQTSPTKKQPPNELPATPKQAKQTSAQQSAPATGPAKLIEAPAQVKDKKPSLRKPPKKLHFREYTIDDFTFLKVLGRGSFGKVLLAELNGFNVCFAVKCLKKQTVIEDDDVESIMIERKVLAFGSSNPFICKLFCTFQTESHLFFAMEWCAGGDLMFHVQKEGKFSEEKARFYSCEMLCALWFMHKRGIIYRDLKLDNIMIYNDGHIRLVDFGMCQGKMYREELLPSNFCGTPEYMAPEIIKGVKYNHSVDYWALGVVIFEMCVGTSPFQGTDEDELLWNVCHQEVHYPRFLSTNVKDLIALLLKRDPAERLGMSTSTAGTIESQPWFLGVNWNAVENCKSKPPFIPELMHQADVSYFDQYFTKEDPSISPTNKSVNAKDQLLFEGFNYTNHNMTE